MQVILDYLNQTDCSYNNENFDETTQICLGKHTETEIRDTCVVELSFKLRLKII